MGTNRNATQLERTLRNTGKLAKNQRLVLGVQGVEVSFETSGFYQTPLPQRSDVIVGFAYDLRALETVDRFMFTDSGLCFEFSPEVKSLGEDVPKFDFEHTLR